MKTTLLFILSLFLIVQAHSQKEEACNTCRRNAAIGIGIMSAASSYYLLDQLWYKNYEQSPLHSFNDNSEWLQMDKAGHFMTSYTLGRYSSDIMQWTGMSKKKSMWLGGSVGLIYLTGIEILDGRSKKWGFSWGDMIANSAGTLFFISQENFWNEQRIVLKFSYTNSEFGKLYPDQFGNNFQQRVLKDYNAQTYWASINVSRFLASDATFPRWLNVAIGYGATEMKSAKTNIYNVDNSIGQRELYFSFDADLTRVKWKRKWMKTTAKVLSFIKIPSPTLEIKNAGQLKMHWMFF